MDNNNMNDKQIKQLADQLADALVKRIYGVANTDNVGINEDEMIWYADNEEDQVVGELARLMTLQNLYEEREEYEKCHLIGKHINRLQNIIENL